MDNKDISDLLNKVLTIEKKYEKLKDLLKISEFQYRINALNVMKNNHNIIREIYGLEMSEFNDNDEYINETYKLLKSDINTTQNYLNDIFELLKKILVNSL